VPRDRDVVIVDEKLDVEPICNGDAGRLRVIPLLLGAVRAEAEDYLIAVCVRDSIYKWPNVAQTA
jgi:hypothetical protein